VKEFYDRGGRYMSLAHNGNSQLADSNTGEVQGYLYNNGLSPLGREVIAEMNRLGMMVDLSHPSKGANLEAMRLSKAQSSRPTPASAPLPTSAAIWTTNNYWP